MVKEMIECKLASGPGGLRRCFQYFDIDGSGSIDYDEFKQTLHHKVRPVLRCTDVFHLTKVGLANKYSARQT
jgi:hypothetical protein